MIKYPAIFKFTGQDELLYLATKSSFEHQFQLQQAYFTPEDLLIDATGQVYLLQRLNQHNSSLAASVRQFELPELTALVQAHFFALAQSCVVKIQAPSVSALFDLLAETAPT